MTNEAHDGAVPTRALLVTSANSLAAASGGVQVYTRELIATLQAASFDLVIVPHGADRSIRARLRRLGQGESYRHKVPNTLVAELVDKQSDVDARFILLNGVELATIASRLRRQLPDHVAIALFSFGLKSVDFLYRIEESAVETSRAAQTLGRLLLDEHVQRRALDHVFCLSEFEAGVERWIGAKNVTWLPASVEGTEALQWRPIPKRLGCVTTLSHRPNYDGLLRFLEALQGLEHARPEFRLVGGPPTAAEPLRSRFPWISYLGPLNDKELRDEASTWSCFVHPLFCYAAGASMKLSLALQWGLPVATTPAGARGYIWREGSLPLAHTPMELASRVLAILDGSDLPKIRSEVVKVRNSSPTREDVGARIREALLRRA